MLSSLRLGGGDNLGYVPQRRRAPRAGLLQDGEGGGPVEVVPRDYLPRLPRESLEPSGVLLRRAQLDVEVERAEPRELGD